MSLIRFDRVGLKLKDRLIISNVNFEVEEGETLILLGRSGSGKTTLLKMINRLIAPTSGEVLLKGEPINGLDPIQLRRSIGYSVQSTELFPHMTVGENIALVPFLLNWPKDHIKARIDTLLRLFHLSPSQYRDRYPSSLSGGQQQRIGVARALAADPPILLMDEPFGALDPMTRRSIQDEFLELSKQMKKTVIFVTHDIDEALMLGDRILLIDRGRIQQIGTKEEFLTNPASPFVERFFAKNKKEEEPCLSY